MQWWKQGWSVQGAAARMHCGIDAQISECPMKCKGIPYEDQLGVRDSLSQGLDGSPLDVRHADCR